MQNEEFNQPDYNAPLAQELAELQPEVEPPTPNNPPWNIPMAIGVWVLSIAFIVIFPTLFLAPYLIQKGIGFSDPKIIAEFAIKDPTAIILQLLSVIPAHIFTLVLAWFVVTYFKKYSFRQTLGWNWGGFKWWYALIISFLFYGIIILLNIALGIQETEFDRMLKSSRNAVYLVAFFATFTAPLVEEVVYRGILFSALQNPKKILFEQNSFLRNLQEFYGKHSTIFAVLIITFLFTIIHIPQYSNNNTPNYATVLALVMLSLVLTLIRVKTKNLLPCIVLHTVFNGMQALLLIAEPYLPKIEPTTLEKAASIIKLFP